MEGAPGLDAQAPPSQHNYPVDEVQDPEDDGEEEDELEQIATESPDVELVDAEFAEPSAEIGIEEVAQALNTVSDYIESIAEVPIEPPLNAATQTPREPHLPSVDTNMITASDGEHSEYEAHFSQGIGKDDKARKLANRTPEPEGKSADKLGKKQRKQLQFPALEEKTDGGAPARSTEGLPSAASGSTATAPSPARKLKNSNGDKGVGGTLVPALSGKADKRKGKDVPSGSSVGK
ncbi:unnamed protein product [Calypogeia fissa]